MDAQPLTPVDAATLAGSVMAHDLSPFGLFMQADWVVKTVMLGLLVCSIIVWAIVVEKGLTLRRLRTKAELFEERFWSGTSVEALYDRVGKRPADPLSAVFAAGMREWRQAVDKGLLVTAGLRASLQQRVERVMMATIGREMTRLEAKMNFLASVGSTAPFVGLFGTVWGIMRSFTGIAQAQNTSLAVVAPGIAEALFATAIGLFAAIPAVIAYNYFSSQLSKYADRLDNFAADFSAMLSRNLEEQRS